MHTKKPPRSPTRNGGGICRLSDDVVRGILESCYLEQPPPQDINFTIVRVGANGKSLSPPAYEFEDGLYVLLPPDKGAKRKPKDLVPHVPGHLKHLVMENPPPENCLWQLSGPQFPVPTAIQQRYAYPKGGAPYSSSKGASLWTMCSDDGTEHRNYRLLHVYYSTKRASNRTSAGPTRPKAKPKAPRRKRKATSPRVPRKGRERADPITSSPTATIQPRFSTLSRVPQPSWKRTKQELPWEQKQALTSPSRLHTAPSAQVTDPHSYVTPISQKSSHPLPRRRKLGSSTDDDNDDEDDDGEYLPHVDEVDRDDDEESVAISLVGGADFQGIPCMDEGSAGDNAVRDSLAEIDDFWNPKEDGFLFDDAAPDSLQSASPATATTAAAASQPDHPTNTAGADPCGDFSSRLSRLHESLATHCLQAAVDDQAPMLSTLQGWATHIAQDPLDAWDEDYDDDDGHHVTEMLNNSFLDVDDHHHDHLQTTTSSIPELELAAPKISPQTTAQV